MVICSWVLKHDRKPSSLTGCSEWGIPSVVAFFELLFYLFKLSLEQQKCFVIYAAKSLNCFSNLSYFSVTDFEFTDIVVLLSVANDSSWISIYQLKIIYESSRWLLLIERNNSYYFSRANQQKAGTKIYSLTQCSLTMNGDDWPILAGNGERINSHCLTRFLW